MPESRSHARCRWMLVILLSGVLWSALAQGQSYGSNAQTRDLPSGSARVTDTRSETNGRTLETRIVEVPSINGGYELFSAAERETVHQGNNTVRVVERLFLPDPDGRRRLYQVTQAETTTLPEGSERTERTLSQADLNGRLQIIQSEIEVLVPMNTPTAEKDDHVRPHH